MLSHQLKLLGDSANKHLLIHRPSNIQAQADLMVKHTDFWLLETIYLYCSGTSKFFPAPKARIALVYKTFSSWQNRQCKEMKSWLGDYVSWISIIWGYSVKGQKPKLFPIPIPENPNLGLSMVPWWPSLWWIYGPERWGCYGEHNVQIQKMGKQEKVFEGFCCHCGKTVFDCQSTGFMLGFGCTGLQTASGVPTWDTTNTLSSGPSIFGPGSASSFSYKWVSAERRYFAL